MMAVMDGSAMTMSVTKHRHLDASDKFCVENHLEFILFYLLVCIGGFGYATRVTIKSSNMLVGNIL